MPTPQLLPIPDTPEVRAQLRAHANKWIKFALSCEPADRERGTRGILGCYEAAKLAAPRVVWCSSPRQMKIAYGRALACWQNRKSGTPHTPLPSPLTEADEAAIQEIVRQATLDPAFPSDGTELQHSAFATECAETWHSAYQGGRFWASSLAFLTAFRDLKWLDLPEYKVLKPYEEAAEGTFRVVCEQFCIISDTPAELHIDASDLPHNDSGPSHLWRDGWKLWYIHGVAVTEQIVMRPETLTVEQIKAESNVEVRRIMISRFGTGKYLDAIGATMVHSDVSHGCPRAVLRTHDGDQYLVGSDTSTGRVYFMRVPSDVQTCAAAHAAICGFSESAISCQS